jgi:hypothetical protein
MTIAPNFYAKARSETAELLHYDLARLSPDQMLRLDCATALRLAIDDLQGRICRGETADVTKLLTISEALARILPASVMAEPPPEPREDPRETMWQIYKQMRERGELPLKALPDEGGHQTRIAELEDENRRLRLAVAGGSPISPPLSDIVPACERAECDAGPRAGPDDPKPRRPGPVIEGTVKRPNPPAAPVTPKYDYDKEQGWRDHVLPDGTITPTPMSRGRWWGPVG